MKKTVLKNRKPLTLSKETLVYCLGGERMPTGTPDPGPSTADDMDPGQTYTC